MEQNHIRKRVLTVTFLFLFIGIAFAQSINIDTIKAFEDNDLVKVTTLVSGFKKDNINTVELTKQQIRELQRIFDELKIRLSTPISLKETQRIFNDTIAAINRYHLLPNDMSIEQAKRLIAYSIQNQYEIPVLKKISTKFQSDRKDGAIQNFFCLIAGNTSNTHFAKPITEITMRLFDIMDYHSENIILLKLSTVLWIILNPFNTISQMILHCQGNHYGVSIFFGNFHYYPYPNWLSPAQGWITTNGINGQQNISGSFWGQKMISGWQPQDDWYMNYTWKGCTGFTGFITYIGVDSAYYLGSALHVNVGSNRP